MSNESAERVAEHASEHLSEHTDDHAQAPPCSSDGIGENTLVGKPFPLDDNEVPESAGHAEDSRSRLTKLARNHGLVFLVAILSFAAADTWSTLSGLLIAELLCVITAALAGISITTLAHEWFHYFGARFSKANINIPTRQGLFVYVWDFGSNSAGQFLIMSIAGSIGSGLAVILLWSTVPADTLGRAVLWSAAAASFIYSALIEWPVIKRARLSGDPLAELSQIDKPLLSRSFLTASISGIVLTVLLVVLN